METKEKVIKEVQRIEEDTLYSSKGHFYAAQFWANFHLLIGIPASIMAAVAGASALSEFNNHELIAGILAITVSALGAVTTFINPNEKATIHLNAGNNYSSLKNQARIFSEIDIHSGTLDGSIEKMKKLCKDRDGLNCKSPQIPKWAFNKAKKGVKDGEAKYKVD